LHGHELKLPQAPVWEDTLDGAVERHQVAFLNPDLVGIFAAFLLHRAGADVAIFDELMRWRKPEADFPIAFPFEGTFRPSDVNLHAVSAGFPPPVWNRIPQLEIHLPTGRILINSDGGVGGLLLSIAEPFRTGRSLLMGWLQNEITKTREHISFGSQQKSALIREIETSVVDSILGLDLPDPDPFILLIDTLSILAMNRGARQLDIRDFHVVLACILNGWHVPVPGDRTWAELLLTRFMKEGGRYRKIESINAIQNFGKRSCIVRTCEGILSAAQLLVMPENDRFCHPLASGVSTIQWHTWHGRFSDKLDEGAKIGALRPDPKRSPMNDNFLTWRTAPAPDDRFTVSAPVESRFMDGNRLDTITSRIKFLLTHRLDWHVSELAGSPPFSPGEQINLPGTSPSISYPEGPLWGDDILSRLNAAERLSRSILERVR
jgi:hypothetical protein